MPRPKIETAVEAEDDRPEALQGLDATGRTVATLPPAQSVAERRRQSSGRGVSFEQRDKILPFAILLQYKSPQVERGSESYIEGAQPGSFYLKGHATRELVSGEEGFLWQLCDTSHTWVEWRPRGRGGGVVARHQPVYRGDSPDTHPEFARRGPNPDYPQQVAWLVGDEGNYVVETRYLVGNLFIADDAAPYLDGTAVPGAARRGAATFFLPLRSTGHAVYRRLNTQLGMRRNADGNPIDAWDRLFRFRSRRRTKGANSWLELEFADEGQVSDELWELGEATHRASQAGRHIIQDEALAEEVVDPETGEITPAGGRAAAGKLDDHIPF